MDESIRTILKEIEDCLVKTYINQEDIKKFINIITNANNVFVDGRGRSKLKLSGFVMRLTQMGITSHEISEVTTPAIEKGDLLILCTGSGGTANQIEHANTSSNIGAHVVTITTVDNSPLKKMSDVYIKIDADPKGEKASKSMQPLGTLFEQAVEIFLDALVIKLMKKLKVSNDEMLKRHNNLE